MGGRMELDKERKGGGVLTRVSSRAHESAVTGDYGTVRTEHLYLSIAVTGKRQDRQA